MAEEIVVSPKQEIYRHSFLVAQIMCGSCGYLVGEAILQEAIQDKALLPPDAEILIDEEPDTMGLHWLSISIESSDTTWPLQLSLVTDAFEKTITAQQSADGKPFQVIHLDDDIQEISPHRHDPQNLFINLLLLIILIIISLVLPPSFPLMVGLIALSFLVTAWTSRHHFQAFLQQIGSRQIFSMASGVSLGWMLSLVHAIYHTVMMPMMVSFSLLLMNVIMPVSLISLVNVLESVQQRIQRGAIAMQRKGMQSLFQFSDFYESFDHQSQQWFLIKKAALKEGMHVRIKSGECVPADGRIILGQSMMNTSIWDGETRRLMSVGDSIFAGTVNLGSEVVVEVSQPAFYSLTNQIIFGVNRQRRILNTKPSSEWWFIFFYMTLILISLVLVLVTPLALGVFSWGLALQSLVGIVFAICPCTIAIAHQLPRLMLQQRLSEKGILLRHADFFERTDAVHTIVFDKTGTLTSDESHVVFTQVSDDVWERVCSLEAHGGANHPLAKAICQYKKQHVPLMSMTYPVPEHMAFDRQHRGLTGVVQGHQIHVGNDAYFREEKILNLPIEPFPPEIQERIRQGLTPIFVAQDGVYHGCIFVQHDIDQSVIDFLKLIKQQKQSSFREKSSEENTMYAPFYHQTRAKPPVKLVMLTGDTYDAAFRFDQQCGAVFDEIHARLSPSQKEEVIKQLLQPLSDEEAKGVWYVGDGCNDLLSATCVSERGGVACAMNQKNQTAYFADVVLNHHLNFLLQSEQLNRTIQRIKHQNQAILMLSTVVFFILLIGLPLVGSGIGTFIPLMLMMSTTGLIVLNTMRLKMVVDKALDQHATYLTHFFASDVSLGLVLLGLVSLLTSLSFIVFSTGHWSLPTLMFSGSVMLSASSGLMLISMGCLSIFFVLLLAGLTHHALSHHLPKTSEKQSMLQRCSRFFDSIRPSHLDKKASQQDQGGCHMPVTMLPGLENAFPF